MSSTAFSYANIYISDAESRSMKASKRHVLFIVKIATVVEELIEAYERVCAWETVGRTRRYVQRKLTSKEKWLSSVGSFSNSEDRLIA